MVKAMGRRIPIGDHEENNVDLTSSVLWLSLQMAWITATLAMITALCVRRKSTSPPPPQPNPSSSPSVKVAAANKSEDITTQETTMVPPLPEAARMATDVESEERTENESPKELPLPPAMKTLRGTYSCNNLTRTMSMRRVDPNLSRKMPRSLSVSTQEIKNNIKKKGKLKSEDSIWRKTIILGERCRPDEEDDAIIYDNKGKKIPAYHKKTQSTYSLSRANSRTFNTNAIPGQDKDKGIVTKDEEVLVQDNKGIVTKDEEIS